MKAIISTTYSDTYLYFLPITTFLWNKLGVDVICFMPSGNSKIERSGGFIQGVLPDGNKRMYLINETIKKNNGNLSIHFFKSPEHKEATYAQCSRLYGACLDLPEDEILITSDVDMGVFRNPSSIRNAISGSTDMPLMEIIGADLVPNNQYPICYLKAPVFIWKRTMQINGRGYQECLDDMLGYEEMENMRGNLWSRDQETIFNKVKEFEYPSVKTNRAKEGTQFATNRYDRDDSYILDRLNPDTIDYHMNRPGYEDKNFETILTILKYHYPLDDFTWLIEYNLAYKKILC